MDSKNESETPFTRRELDNLSEFATDYVRQHYEFGGSNADLSARDLRYAALELGYEIEHEEALVLVERINTKILEERNRLPGGFLADYFYGMHHSNG